MINEKRIKAIASNAVYSLAPSAANQLLSLVVIRFFAASWWGQIVELQFWQYLLASICAWGSKDFLIRCFSVEPAVRYKAWNSWFSTRLLFLLLPVLLVLFIVLPLHIHFHLSIWITTRFVAQSFEPIINYEKRFSTGLLAEILFFVVLVLGLMLFNTSLTYNSLLWVLSFANVVRVLSILFGFINWLKPQYLYLPSLHVLKEGLMFMLLAFTGFLETRLDLGLIEALLPKTALAHYQVFTNFLIIILTGPAFLMAPFIKNIYRLRVRRVRALSATMFITGLGFCAAGVTVLWFIIHYLYGFEDTWQWYLFGFLYTVPAYWYGPVVFYLFKQQRERDVIFINLAGITTDALLCIWLIPAIGITGALIAKASSQWIMNMVYQVIIHRESKTLA